MVTSQAVSSVTTHPLENGLSIVKVDGAEEVGVSVLCRGLDPSLCHGIPCRTELPEP